jgi:hypothetical protein
MIREKNPADGTVLDFSVFLGLTFFTGFSGAFSSSVSCASLCLNRLPAIAPVHV